MRCRRPADVSFKTECSLWHKNGFESEAMASQEKASVLKKTMRTCASKLDSYQLSDLVKVMNNMRKEGTLCDVTLVVQGRSFPAHRMVLAAASHFFRLMFTTKMKESVSPVVELKEIEPDIIEQLIDFIYTAQISLDRSNAQLLLYAADLYQIDPVKRICIEFLKKHVTAPNCLGLLAFADMIHCPELKATAEDCVLRHFTEVMKFDKFLQLDVTQLTNILRQDKVIVFAEEQVYSAALRWLKHDVSNRQQYVAEVLSCVRFPLMSQTFLSKRVQSEPLIQNDSQCLNMLINGMRYHLLSWKDRRDLAQISRPRLQNQTHCIAQFKSSKPQYGRFFNIKDCSWRRVSCTFEGRMKAAAVCWDGVIYILGGSNGRIPIKHLDCYNVQEDSWFSQSGQFTPRNSLAACAYQGNIYTSGGSLEDGTVLDIFECFNTKTDSWQVESNMLVPRCCHASVEVNGLIYVCGGMTGSHITPNCEVYNPSTQQWRELCAMRQARNNHGLVVVQDRIYAVGGRGPRGFLKSVECYNIATNEWHTVASLPFPLMVKCAAAGNVIYVLAGKCQEADYRHVLEYHTETDKWLVSFKVPPLPFKDSLICMVDM